MNEATEPIIKQEAHEPKKKIEAKEKQPIKEETIKIHNKEEANMPREEYDSDERSKPTFKQALSFRRNP